MTQGTAELDDDIDSVADIEIRACLRLDAPKSFFLFAGAGSGKTRSLVQALERLRTDSVGHLTILIFLCRQFTVLCGRLSMA